MKRIRKTCFFILYIPSSVTSRSWSKIEIISKNLDVREIESDIRTEADPFEYTFPEFFDSLNASGTNPADERPCERCDEIILHEYPSSYQTNPIPSHPPRGYFNYDVTRNARY